MARTRSWEVFCWNLLHLYKTLQKEESWAFHISLFKSRLSF